MKRDGYTLTDCADFYNFKHKKWNSRYGKKITRIIPHHMAGNLSPRDFYNIVAGKRQMTPTVAVFSDGQVWAYVPEEFRPWTTGSQEADGCALTLEIANDGGSTTDWHISDKAYNAAVQVMADWCKRYNINPKYTYRGNGINMHRDWAATACPGGYMYKKIVSGQLERDIRKAMNTRDKAKLEQFVKLLYKNILHRHADKSGLDYWVKELYNGGASAKTVTKSFFNSKEYINKKTNNEQFVKDLYEGYLDRKADASGLKYWVNQLKSGSSRNSIMDGFANSKEFKNRCAKYTL